MIDRDTATRRARALLDAHGLQAWSITWTKSKRSYGACDHSTRTIRLSWPITRLNPPEQLRHTLLHEIAHARAGPDAGHGPAWQTECARLGIPPQRCISDQVATPPGRWTGTCHSCGFTVTRIQLRAAARKASCPQCDSTYNPDRVLTWTRTHQTSTRTTR